jgi:hypothetical protein
VAWALAWDLSKIETLTKVLAILGTASFFGYKAVVGFFITNTSISLVVRRFAADDAEDFVGITVTLAKGDRGALVVHDLTVWVTPDGAQPIDCDVESGRLSYNTTSIETDDGKAIEKLLVRRDVPSTDNPFLHLSPGESTQFAAYTRVPRHLPCVVNAVLLGRKPSDRPVGQWRASAVSFPEERVGAP